jgi:hypothetical protein
VNPSHKTSPTSPGRLGPITGVASVAIIYPSRLSLRRNTGVFVKYNRGSHRREAALAVNQFLTQQKT